MDNEWFEQLIDDCRGIATEYGFTSRWSMVEGRHELGKRILQENDNFKRKSIYGQEIIKKVAGSLGFGERTVQYAVQFAQMFPDLSLLPEGKDTTWSKIVHQYLPKSEQKERKQRVCPHCGKPI
jgi:hypothetical protein